MNIRAETVVARFLQADADIPGRIEAIPGWDRSTFLRSLHDQAKRGRALSPKQMAVLEQIESKQKQKPVPKDVIVWAARGYYNKADFTAVVKALYQDGTAQILDRTGAFSKLPAEKMIPDALASGWFGQSEMYSEYNADEEDPKLRADNDEAAKASLAAAYEIQEAKLDIRRDGPLVTVTIRPNPKDVARKHKLKF